MTTYDLVFEGGGAKGMAFVGALGEFAARGFIFDRLLGTSTGAITATLLAAGYNAQEMLSALNERVNGQPVFVGFLGTPGTSTGEEAPAGAIRQFFQNLSLPYVPAQLQEDWRKQIVESVKDQPFVHHVLSLDEQGGWYAAEGFLNWFAQKLDSARLASPTQRFSQMNLEQFFRATGREVSMVASDTTAQRMLVLNHRTAPQCPLVWAACMSMSLPLVWQEVEWKAEWGHYRGEEISGHIVVDGGLLSNFPIELLVSDMAHVTEVMGPKGDSAVLGFLIDESLPVPGAPPPPPSPAFKSWPTDTPGVDALPNFRFDSLRSVQRINRLIDTATKAHDKMVMESMEALVVRLPAEGYTVTEFDMSDARREALINAARQATRDYFEHQSPITTPAGGEASKADNASRDADHIATRILR